MQYEGNILKMKSELAGTVKYTLPIGEEQVDMNALIGKEIRMQFDGRINCISCGKQTKTSFGQGFCYNCLQTAPEARVNQLCVRNFRKHTWESRATWSGPRNMI